MRTTHYWKEAKSNRLPSSFLFIDTETRPVNKKHRNIIELHKLFIGVARYVRLEDGEERDTQYYKFEDIEAFHCIVESRLCKSRPLWIMAHNLAFDFTILNGWKIMFNEECCVNKFIFEDGVFFAKIDHPLGKIVLCDSFNYFKVSLEKMGQSLDIKKLEMPTDYCNKEEWYTYCERDVDVLAESVLELVRFNHQHRLGRFTPTIASLAFNCYKTKFMKHDVLVHDNQDALKLERSGYYGGIVDTNYIGVAPKGKVYELDVNSMYPFQCTRPLPYQFVGYKEHPSIKCVKDLMREYMVCVEVWLKTKENTYPLRHGNKVVYPTGEYCTVLMHPEIMNALIYREVKAITKVAWYSADTIFKEYMEFFSTKKNEYEQDNNESFRTICKYYMNTLYGKTAQRSERWLPIDYKHIEEIADRLKVSPQRIDFLCAMTLLPDRLHDTLLIPNLDLALKIRNLYGVEECFVGVGESRDSCPVIAATITSYARVYLRFIQNLCGKYNWYYSDTDSIWCNVNGYENLCEAKMIKENELGKLSLKGIHDTLIVHGKKDYETDEMTKRKGIRKNAEQLDENVFSQWHFPSAKTILKSKVFDAITLHKIVKTLRRKVDWCKVTSSGFTKPLSYPEEFNHV